jgi:hypothetical protein
LAENFLGTELLWFEEKERNPKYIGDIWLNWRKMADFSRKPCLRLLQSPIMVHATSHPIITLNTMTCAVTQPAQQRI